MTPSRFIERAEEKANAWEEEISRSVAIFLRTGDESVLKDSMEKIASDISTMCDRVDTGQLKASFEGKLE